MVCSMICFAVNDAVIKSLGGVLPIFQTLAVRGGMVVVLLAILVMRSGWRVQELRRRDQMILLLRVAAEVGAAFFIVTALFNMELANMTAILQILPLTIPLAAFMFLWPDRLALIGAAIIVGTGAFTLYRQRASRKVNPA